MRIVVVGSQGQLGSAIQKTMTEDELMLVDLPEHDITDLSIVASIRDFGPDAIIHTAAMTNVDGCEQDPDLAYKINVVGTRNVALAARQSNAAMVYISTDYVFDGTKGSPYWEYDAPNPLSVYARTKWMGEQVTRDLLERFYIVRIAWLYGDGPRNFVRTVLRLAESKQMRMVTDEVGSPTYARDVAQALAQLVRQPAYGIYHLPNAGACSRYDWAREILHLTNKLDVEVIPTTNFQRAACVPKQVELNNIIGANLGITMRPWTEALQDYIQHLDEA
ncbi:MAG: dTDP-4-dehydrorhamnose reductase [Chloroflexi bacterium]|jgi:dTDP-4-dehydrorhamnose reductase|nr:dTDP-4-dehydrorhamnose reductase [Chloroflexota bacterium]